MTTAGATIGAVGSMLTDVERYWFVNRLTAELAERKGDAFEQFFKDIMSRRHPGDFVPIVPWGNLGDMGRDGFRSSTRTIYAMYAPHEDGEAKTRQKMSSDLEKALGHWSGQFDEWAFVLPGRRGIPTTVEAHLAELRANHAPLKLTLIDHQAVARIVMRELGRDALVELLGVPPAAGHVVVGAREIQDVLAHVSASTAPRPGPILPPPANKIDFNELSMEVEELLNLGRHRQHFVSEYLNGVRDAEYGDRLATVFHDKYQAIKLGEPDPDRVFEELLSWVAGNERASDRAYMFGAYAVLMYFFERCDIFERPQEVT